MTQKQSNYRKKLIRDIHISSRYQLFYKENREEYEALLQEYFGHGSSAKLSITQLEQLSDFMCANKPLPKRNMVTPQQLYKMSELRALKARTNTDAALLAFAARICRRTPKDLPDLSMDEGQKVIVALSKMGGA